MERRTAFVLLLALLAGFIVTGCVRTGRLYPVNALATPGGTLHARFVGYGTGHGDVEIRMPDGELLKGKYTIARRSPVGFGSILGGVRAAGLSASGSAATTDYAIEGHGRGTASAVGDRGTTAQCEFVNDNLDGHGFGACQTSAGALYRLQY